MGNAHHSCQTRGVIMEETGPPYPMYFHNNHSENIEVSQNKKRARRVESFCKGICFGSRPITPSERIYIKFAELSNSWSGVLRFGFTSHDPRTINHKTLPRYACPDLTSKAGYWCKALGERYAETGNVISFYVQRNGDVMYGINGDEKGVFFSGVNPNLTLWPLVDVYGNTIAVEFVEGQQIAPGDLNSLNEENNQRNNNQQRSSSEITCGQDIAVNHYNVTARLPFHEFHGKNIQLSSDRYFATRKNGEYCNAYGFTNRPLRNGEKLVIQIHGIDQAYVGGLAFGLTSCNPETLVRNSLPDDADNLLDRPEYWVVNKNLCANPQIGDELSIKLADNGEVHYGKNNSYSAILMHVDNSLPLWAFFDLYGNITRVKSLGISERDDASPDALPSSADNNKSQKKSQIKSRTPTSATNEATPNVEDNCRECVICYENPPNCALYACGHMCLCSTCAATLRREINPLCPLCRQPVRDVIKIYR